MTVTSMRRQVVGEIPTCGQRLFDIASGCAYNYRGVLWFMVRVWGFHGDIEASGAGVQDWGV